MRCSTRMPALVACEPYVAETTCRLNPSVDVAVFVNTCPDNQAGHSDWKVTKVRSPMLHFVLPSG